MGQIENALDGSEYYRIKAFVKRHYVVTDTGQVASYVLEPFLTQKHVINDFRQVSSYVLEPFLKQLYFVSDYKQLVPFFLRVRLYFEGIQSFIREYTDFSEIESRIRKTLQTGFKDTTSIQDNNVVFVGTNQESLINLVVELTRLEFKKSLSDVTQTDDTEHLNFLKNTNNISNIDEDVTRNIEKVKHHIANIAESISIEDYKSKGIFFELVDNLAFVTENSKEDVASILDHILTSTLYNRKYEDIAVYLDHSEKELTKGINDDIAAIVDEIEIILFELKELLLDIEASVESDTTLHLNKDHNDNISFIDLDIKDIEKSRSDIIDCVFEVLCNLHKPFSDSYSLTDNNELHLDKNINDVTLSKSEFVKEVLKKLTDEFVTESYVSLHTNLGIKDDSFAGDDTNISAGSDADFSFVKGLSDSLQVIEQIEFLRNYTRNFTDITSIQDLPSLDLQKSPFLNEAMITDIVNVLIVQSLKFHETIGTATSDPVFDIGKMIQDDADTLENVIISLDTILDSLFVSVQSDVALETFKTKEEINTVSDNDLLAFVKKNDDVLSLLSEITQKNIQKNISDTTETFEDTNLFDGSLIGFQKRVGNKALIAEEIFLLLSVIRNFIDTVETTSDLPRKELHKQLADNTTIVDAAKLVLNYVREFSEDLNVPENTVLSIGKGFEETTNTESDALLHVLKQIHESMNSADETTLTMDTLKNNVSNALDQLLLLSEKQTQDETSITDDETLDINKSNEDLVLMTSQVYLLWSITKDFSDTVNIADNTPITLSKPLSDAFAVNDILILTTEYSRLIDDPVVIDDDNLFVINKTLNETVSVPEVLAFILSQTYTDTSSIQDNKTLHLLKAFSENQSTLSNIKFEIEKLIVDGADTIEDTNVASDFGFEFLKGLSNKANVQELVTLLNDFNRNFIDDVNIDQLISLLLSRDETESISVSDIHEILVTYNKLHEHIVNFADDIQFIDLDKVLSDQSNSVSNLSYALETGFTDSPDLLDTVTKVIEFTRTVNEDVGIEVIQSHDLSKIFSDDSIVSDVFNLVSNYNRTFNEEQSISSDIQKVIQFSRLLDDDTSISTFIAKVIETNLLNETLLSDNTLLNTNLQSIEQINTIDSGDWFLQNYVMEDYFAERYVGIVQVWPIENVVLNLTDLEDVVISNNPVDLSDLVYRDGVWSDEE